MALVSMLAMQSCNKEDVTGKKLRLICEELRPYSYVEDGQLKGISAGVVSGILGMMELDKVSVEITGNWTLAMELLDGPEQVALFTTGITAQRKDKYQWAGPIAMFSAGFVGLSDGGHRIGSLAEARALPSVGVVTGYATVGMLQAEGFQNLRQYSNLSLAIAALYGEEISAVFDITDVIRMTADSDQRDIARLSDLYTYSTTQGYIAFSKAVSPTLVKNWQEKLDLLKKQGFVQEVYDQYLPGTLAPGLLSVFTEENPPQSFRSAGGILTGSSVEMVQAMMQQMERNETVTLTGWTDAMNQILVAPNSMAFSTLRTAERENLFEWVGPVCRKSYCFFVKSSGQIQLAGIDDAKSLGSIGVPTGWASEQELINRGFTNILTWPTPAEVFEKLMDGTIEAAVLNDIAIPSLAEQTGFDVNDVRMALVLSSGETWLAFSKDTKAEYIQQWQSAYTTIQNNGKFEEIWKRWYPNIDW